MITINRKPCLILIGGAPGVGKSTLASRLLQRLPHSVWFDGDDLWRMNPFQVNDRTRALVMRNIRALLSSFLQEDFEVVIFSWVMHTPDIVHDVLRDVPPGTCDILHRTLICSESTLRQRIADDHRERSPELACNRLQQTRIAAHELLNNEHDTPDQSADKIIAAVSELRTTAAIKPVNTPFTW